MSGVRRSDLALQFLISGEIGNLTGRIEKLSWAGFWTAPETLNPKPQTLNPKTLNQVLGMNVSGSREQGITALRFKCLRV